MQGDNPRGKVVLGSPDISSLGDLGNAYEALDRMRPFPFDPADVFLLAMATLFPMAPLMLTVYPLGDMLELVWKLMV